MVKRIICRFLKSSPSRLSPQSKQGNKQTGDNPMTANYNDNKNGLIHSGTRAQNIATNAANIQNPSNVGNVSKPIFTSLNGNKELPTENSPIPPIDKMMSSKNLGPKQTYGENVAGRIFQYYDLGQGSHKVTYTSDSNSRYRNENEQYCTDVRGLQPTVSLPYINNTNSSNMLRTGAKGSRQMTKFINKKTKTTKKKLVDPNNCFEQIQYNKLRFLRSCTSQNIISPDFNLDLKCKTKSLGRNYLQNTSESGFWCQSEAQVDFSKINKYEKKDFVGFQDRSKSRTSLTMQRPSSVKKSSLTAPISMRIDVHREYRSSKRVLDNL